MKTKNQMIVGVILLVLLCMLACSCNVVNRQAEGPHVPSLQKGCVFSFDGDRTVSRLFAVDGNILAVTQQEPYFSYISVEEKRLMTSFGKKGRAGGGVA